MFRSLSALVSAGLKACCSPVAFLLRKKNQGSSQIRFKIILLNDGGGEFPIESFPCVIGRRPEGCAWDREHCGLSKRHLIISLSSDSESPFTLEHLGINVDTTVEGIAIPKNSPVNFRLGAKIAFVGYEIRIESC